MQSLVRFLLPGLLSLQSWACLGADDYENWYQVELVIFALRNPAVSDEIWSLEHLTYPSNMISVGPEDNTKLSPHTLRQLEQILAHDALLPGVGASAEPVTKFLFKSRSRFKVPAPMRNLPSPGAGKTGQRDGDSSNQAVAFDAHDGVDKGLATRGSASDESAPDYRALFDTDKAIAFRALGSKDHRLDSYVRSIRRSSAYRLLLHQAWRQPIDEHSTSILIQAGKHYDDNYEVDGTITISRSRFLHLKTDLWYTQFAARYQQPSLPIRVNLPPGIAKKYPQVMTWESQRGHYLAIQSHKLEQSRRMRSATLHYIDHPLFGILVRIDAFKATANQQNAFLIGR